MKRVIWVLFTLFLCSSCFHKKEKSTITIQNNSIDSLYQILDPHGSYNYSTSESEFIVYTKDKLHINILFKITSNILSKQNNLSANFVIKFYQKGEKYNTCYALSDMNSNSFQIKYITISQNTTTNKINDEKTEISSLYSIIKKEQGQTGLDNNKIEYSLRINTEFNKDTLNLIANEIKSITSAEIPNVFISFYLPNMIVGAGSYALSKRTEYDNETIINMVQSKNLPKTTPINDGRKIIGTWRMSIGTTCIYQKDGSYYMEDKYNDGSGGTEKLKIVTRHGRRGYIYAEEGTELYVINNDGNLYLYDDYGDFGGSFLKM